jgi:hypothetical protein
MNSHDQEKLLKEILPPDELGDFRQTSLECGLAGLRRERRRRHVVRISTLNVVLVCISLCIVLKLERTAQKQTAQIQPAPAAAPVAPASHVDFINDEQLLALFKDQPVALVGKPGAQRLVFLGNSEKGSSEHPY